MRRAAALAVMATLALGVAAAGRAEVAPPTQPPTPGGVVVALGLANPVLQAGVVRGNEVILARGFEVELARVLARRLGGRVVRFVHVPSTTRLLAASAGTGWHLALAGVEPSSGARAIGALTGPYLTTDVAVVLRRGLRAPRRLSDLRRVQLCAVRGSEAARAAASVRARRATLLAPGPERLRSLVRTGACDAALVPAMAAGRFVAGWRTRLGPMAGRIAWGEGLVAVVARESGLDVARVDRVLADLRRDGTLGRLARTWLGLDPAALRVLR